MKMIQANELLIFLDDGRIVVADAHPEIQEAIKEHSNGKPVIILSPHDIRTKLNKMDDMITEMAAIANENQTLRDTVFEMTRRVNSGRAGKELKVNVTNG